MRIRHDDAAVWRPPFPQRLVFADRPNEVRFRFHSAPIAGFTLSSSAVLFIFSLYCASEAVCALIQMADHGFGGWRGGGGCKAAPPHSCSSRN